VQTRSLLLLLKCSVKQLNMSPVQTGLTCSTCKDVRGLCKALLAERAVIVGDPLVLVKQEWGMAGFSLEQYDH